MRIDRERDDKTRERSKEREVDMRERDSVY